MKTACPNGTTRSPFRTGSRRWGNSCTIRYGDHQAFYWGGGIVWLILAVVLALILAGEH